MLPWVKQSWEGSRRLHKCRDLKDKTSFPYIQLNSDRFQFFLSAALAGRDCIVQWRALLRSSGRGAPLNSCINTVFIKSLCQERMRSVLGRSMAHPHKVDNISIFSPDSIDSSAGRLYITDRLILQPFIMIAQEP